MAAMLIELWEWFAGATEFPIKVLKALQNTSKIVACFRDQRRVIIRIAQTPMVSVLVKNLNDSLQFLFKHVAFSKILLDSHANLLLY
jgi:hypothetical protein